jgi:hypothetical protein
VLTNVLGYARVEDLARYLVDIRSQNRALTNSQVGEIIRLWDNLSKYEKWPITFPLQDQAGARSVQESEVPVKSCAWCRKHSEVSKQARWRTGRYSIRDALS